MKTFLTAEWQDIVMVNYEVESSVLLPHLPYGVELDDFEGKHYVSLVGFQFKESKIHGVPIPIYGSFEEVNLRFYVKRFVNGDWQRGVVFIREIVPYKIVALLANLSYKEHYAAMPMKSSLSVSNTTKSLFYGWKNKESEQFIKADFLLEPREMKENSHEKFIYEHYFGYTKINQNETWEYKVNHTEWCSNKVTSYEVNCDFKLNYGEAFAFLNEQNPHSVYNAVGSSVSIDSSVEKLKYNLN